MADTGGLERMNLPRSNFSGSPPRARMALHGALERVLMAQIQMEPIVEHLRAEMRRALSAAVREVIEGAKFDESALYRAFRHAVRSRCNVWERVPDKYVNAD
jgi:hypothetical protein